MRVSKFEAKRQETSAATPMAFRPPLWTKAFSITAKAQGARQFQFLYPGGHFRLRCKSYAELKIFLIGAAQATSRNRKVEGGAR